MPAEACDLVLYMKQTPNKPDQQLPTTEEKYRSIITAMAEGVVLQEVSGAIIAANPAAERILGLSVNQMMGRISTDSRWRAIHEDGSPFPGETHPAMVTLRTGKPLRNVIMGVHKPDSSITWISINSEPLHGSDEHLPNAVVTTFNDITERKRSEEELRATRELFQKTFHVSPLPSVLTKLPDRIIVDANAAFEQLLGYTRAEVIGRPVSEINLWADPSERQRVAEVLLEEGRVRDIEFTFKTKSGEKGEGIFYSEVVEQGADKYVLTKILDITARKRAEEELRKQQQVLEETVARRTADLSTRVVEVEQLNRALANLLEDLQAANYQQQIAARQLEAANKELEAFSYSVSHDLRAPLRALEGFSAILLESYTDRIDERGRHYLERIQQASNRMRELINDLLNLSRVTRREISRQPVDLSALAQEIVSQLREREPLRDVEFVIEPQLVGQGDAHLLRVALENLLGNAWKFTHQRQKAYIEVGQMTIEDSRSQNADWATHLPPSAIPNPQSKIYYVRDNGAGFDMAYAARLFTPFQRLHSAQEFPGTGIGLAIVQRIIARHGGRIWAEAEVEKGATIYFVI